MLVGWLLQLSLIAEREFKCCYAECPVFDPLALITNCFTNDLVFT
jgi:hypothetical protein